MNHHMGHTSHTAPDQYPPVPASEGATFGVKLLLFGGVFLSTMQGVFVAILASGFGRVWPAANSAKIPLPPPHF